MRKRYKDDPDGLISNLLGRLDSLGYDTRSYRTEAHDAEDDQVKKIIIISLLTNLFEHYEKYGNATLDQLGAKFV